MLMFLLTWFFQVSSKKAGNIHVGILVACGYMPIAPPQLLIFLLSRVVKRVSPNSFELVLVDFKLNGSDKKNLV